MSQQYPQQPGWGAPQPPQPPKKKSIGKIIGIGCGGAVGLFIVIGIIGALVTGGDDGKDASGPTTVSPAASPASRSASAQPKAKVATFRVWGTAPAGALGPINITYGSDSDNRQGKFADGEFTATLPFDGDALYYTVTAQLQGSGDINCEVTVDGHTERGHASGGYNICRAQANKGFLGGWD